MIPFANVLHVIVCVNCLIGLMALIPFKGINRLHPILWPAMVLFGFYDATTFLAQLLQWGNPFSVRYVFALALSSGVLWWAFCLCRLGIGRKVQIWPGWKVQAYQSPTEVWRGKLQVYRDGEYSLDGLADSDP